MDFIQARHDIVRSITQRWLIKCWGRLQGRSRVPHWKNLELQDVASIVDRLLFCDVVSEGDELDFRIRYQGKRITEMYGGEVRGKLVGSILPPAMRESALAAYRHAVTARCPTYTVATIFDREGNPVSYERLLLPFGFDGENVSRILGAFELVSEDGRFDQHGLMLSPPPPQYSVCATIYTVPV